MSDSECKKCDILLERKRCYQLAMLIVLDKENGEMFDHDDILAAIACGHEAWIHERKDGTRYGEIAKVYP